MKYPLLCLTALLLAPLAEPRAGETERPIVGAIRWDAWYGTNGPVKQTEVSLGPPKYHFRLPWYARVVGADTVNINGDSQEIVEKEIAYAAKAGLNYWAFVDYWDDANLSIALRRDRWEKWRALGIPCVTFASAGWDTRPRNERPPSWITWVTATPDTTPPPSQQKPLIDAVTATPDELAAHLREALDWTQRNRDINPSNAIIIYGWNENDEGGWLIPTRGAGGRPNEERIKALSKVLRASSSPTPSPPTLSPRP